MTASRPVVTAVRSPGSRVGAHHAKMPAELREVPAVAAEDADTHAGLDDGIDLAGDGEDEGGFAATVGSENGHVFAGANRQVHVVQHDAIAACDVDMLELKKLMV